MEWLFMPISSLFVQLTVLISGVGLVTVLMHLAIVRKSRRYHGDYHRMKEKELESREVLHHRNLLQDRTKSYE